MASSKTADIVIIGGGIIGISIAYYLAQRKLGRIVVLERDTPGSGSTGRSVASVDLFSGHPAAIKLQVRAYEIFSRFGEIIGEPCGLVTTGFAVLAGPDQQKALREAAKVTQAAGVEVQLLTPLEFSALEQAANTDDLAAAAFIPTAGYGDPMLTTNAFASAARRLGVTIRPGQPVIGLQCGQGRVTGIRTASETISTPVVVCAAGPWSRKLFQIFEVDPLGLYACRHPVLVMQRTRNFGPPHLSILDMANEIYARPEGGDLTLGGSIDPKIGYDAADPDEGAGSVSSEFTFWAAERLVRRYPSLEAAQIRAGWSGLMTISPDWQPVLGALPELHGLYCATGFSGQGYKVSPAVGDLMAGLIAAETGAAELLAPFRPTRFAEDQPLKTSDFGSLG